MRLRRNGWSCLQVLAAQLAISLENARVHEALQQEIADHKQATQALQTALTEVAQLQERLQAENSYLREEIRSDANFEEIVGRSPALMQVLHQVERVAVTDTTVLILGETGTGKELIARAIHNRSTRKDRPLVKVNCAALPSTLIESELFGHEKGAFTGAFTRKVGRFELADAGTIFLDEIGELPLDLQAKLLRVLQDGEFERLGAVQTTSVDVRVIAATNRNLVQHIATGNFREDLYYRLNVFPVTLPPLRERREDLPLLVWYFITRYQGKLGRTIERIPERTMAAFLAYHWPGNIRNWPMSSNARLSCHRAQPSSWTRRWVRVRRWIQASCPLRISRRSSAPISWPSSRHANGASKGRGRLRSV